MYIHKYMHFYITVALLCCCIYNSLRILLFCDSCSCMPNTNDICMRANKKKKSSINNTINGMCKNRYELKLEKIK